MSPYHGKEKKKGSYHLCHLQTEWYLPDCGLHWILWLFQQVIFVDPWHVRDLLILNLSLPEMWYTISRSDALTWHWFLWLHSLRYTPLICFSFLFFFWWLGLNRMFSRYECRVWVSVCVCKTFVLLTIATSNVNSNIWWFICVVACMHC